jgi:hypothetical protein
VIPNTILGVGSHAKMRWQRFLRRGAGDGISQSAILRNAEAHSLYVSAREWRAPISRQRRQPVKRNPFTLPVKLDRRVADTKRRLARLSKTDLVDPLLEVRKNAYAVVRAAWLKASAGKLAKN